MVQTAEELQKISKDNIENAMKSFGTLSKSAQAIAVEIADYTKSSFEQSTAALGLLSAKTLEQAIEIQQTYLKTRLRGRRRPGDQDRRAVHRAREGKPTSPSRPLSASSPAEGRPSLTEETVPSAQRTGLQEVCAASPGICGSVRAARVMRHQGPAPCRSLCRWRTAAPLAKGPRASYSPGTIR